MFGQGSTAGNMSPVLVKESDSHGGAQWNNPLWAIVILIVFLIIIFFAFAMLFNRREKNDSGGFIEGAAAGTLLHNARGGHGGGGYYDGGYGQHAHINAYEQRHDSRDDAIKNVEKHGETQKEIAETGWKLSEKSTDYFWRTNEKIGEVKSEIAASERRIMEQILKDKADKYKDERDFERTERQTERLEKARPMYAYEPPTGVYNTRCKDYGYSYAS